MATCSHPITPPVTLVAAVARNGVIGNGGALPWHLPADLRRFRSLTMGGVLVMGRRTFSSIGAALPGRHTVVVTRDRSWSAPGTDTATSLPQALLIAATHRAPIFVVGGGQIYRLALDHAEAAEITEVDQEPHGDTTFPDLGPQWQVTHREDHDGYSFVSYRRYPDTHGQ